MVSPGPSVSLELRFCALSGVRENSGARPRSPGSPWSLRPFVAGARRPPLCTVSCTPTGAAPEATEPSGQGPGVRLHGAAGSFAPPGGGRRQVPRPSARSSLAPAPPGRCGPGPRSSASGRSTRTPSRVRSVGLLQPAVDENPTVDSGDQRRRRSLGAERSRPYFAYCSSRKPTSTSAQLCRTRRASAVLVTRLLHVMNPLVLGPA